MGERKNSINVAGLATVLLCFFVVGSIDLIGIATNYIKEELALSDSAAGFVPSLMYVWFLLISIPTGLAMNRYGHRKIMTVSLAIISISLIVAICGRSFAAMLVAIGLLGIGNTILSVAMNPTVAALVDGRKLASTLTAGQCVKAAASLLAPMVAAWGAVHAAEWLGWRIVFALFFVFSTAAFAPLAAGKRLFSTTSGNEEIPRASTFAQCFALLKRPAILLAFIAILCHVGSDTGINIIAPQLLVKKLGLPLDSAASAASFYFFFRLAGSLTGIYILRKINIRTALFISLGLLAAGIAVAFMANSSVAVYIAIALMGLGNANVYTLIISQAMLSAPDEQNAVSALMTMGVSGGALFPAIMGFASQSAGIAGAICVIALCIAYIFFYTLRIKPAE